MSFLRNLPSALRLTSVKDSAKSANDNFRPRDKIPQSLRPRPASCTFGAKQNNYLELSRVKDALEMKSAILRTIRCGRSTAPAIGREDQLFKISSGAPKFGRLTGEVSKILGSGKGQKTWLDGIQAALAEPGQNRREVQVPVDVISPAIHRPGPRLSDALRIGKGTRR